MNTFDLIIVCILFVLVPFELAVLGLIAIGSYMNLGMDNFGLVLSESSGFVSFMMQYESVIKIVFVLNIIFLVFKYFKRSIESGSILKAILLPCVPLLFGLITWNSIGTELSGSKNYEKFVLMGDGNQVPCDYVLSDSEKSKNMRIDKRFCHN